MTIPYLVWSFDYQHDSAGPKVLHRLCHELNEAGQEAFVSHPWTHAGWRTPWRRDLPEGDWIAVYPEVVSGNPWNAPRVARYVLNNPGRLGGDREFAPSEDVFVYSPFFDDMGVGPDRLLTLPTVELDIYLDRHLMRDGGPMFYVGKGQRTRDLPGARPLTAEMRRDRDWLADVLNRASVLYCFDNMTGMIDIARLCGCPVVLIPDGERTRDEYDRHGSWVGLGWDELPAPFDSQVIREQQIALHRAFPDQLARFIGITQGRTAMSAVASGQQGEPVYNA